MQRWVEIEFDCLPLRSVGRMDVPIDASPKYRQFCERVKAAFEKHGAHNSYFLYNASCTFHLTNDPQLGMVRFSLEGTLLTDEMDTKSTHADLRVELAGETCSWLIESVVHWLQETVQRAVLVEFDRYIAAGDLEQTRQRIEKLQAASDAAGGFVGMYL